MHDPGRGPETGYEDCYWRQGKMRMLRQVARIATLIFFCTMIVFLLYKISRNGRYQIVVGEITETNSKRIDDDMVTSNKVVSKCFLLDSSTGRVFVYEYDRWETPEGKQVGSVGFYPVDISD